MWYLMAYQNCDAYAQKDFERLSDLTAFVRGLHDGGIKASYLERNFWVLHSRSCASGRCYGTYHLQSFGHGRHLRAVLTSEKVY